MKNIACTVLFVIFMICCAAAGVASETDAHKNGMALINLFKNKKKKTRVAVVKEMLKKTTDFDCRGCYDYPVLDCAIYHTDNPQIVDALIKAGADVNTQAGQDTSLHRAALHNARPEIIDKLIKIGTDVNTTNDFNWTPLFYGTRSPETMKFLINAGANVNVRDTEDLTPLMTSAISLHSTEFIETLVRAGADVNARSSKTGRTAFLIAAEHNENIAKYLK